MERFGPYILQEKIRGNRHSIIFRGQQHGEDQHYIIKILKTKDPTPSEIARFRQECNLIKNLDIDGIVRIYDLIEHHNRFAIVEEAFDGIPLKKLIKSKISDINYFLQIALKVSEILGSIHKKNIVHLNIKPENILINEKTGKIKIADFGIAAILTHANEELYNPEVIDDTLIYISPEQTGRMNRSIDYRTDLYSLGITFYEMLTGDVPFRSKDPMELIHAHIARKPAPPQNSAFPIPPVITDIIAKLLSKNPEERYQNGFGVMADIKECIRQIDEKKSIESFELGKHDISNKFIIPQKLFGRGKDIERLISSFDSIAARKNGAAIMVVMGAPGIGKSAMINEIYKPIVARKGYFISGKYEQFRRDKPYSGIIQAFQLFVKQILSESEERIALWKESLLSVLGESGKVITDVIPEVELIIGKQPDLPALGPEESKNRFNFIFEKFTGVFPTKEHPVALFLDDLQWADSASLQLLQNILSGSGLNYFFLILSYRDNEVNESHPVMDFLRHLEKNKSRLDRITLGALTIRDVTDFIRYFLRCSDPEGRELAELLVKKTGGNPFFVNQFLYTLYNEKMIVHEGALGWRWDVNKISRMQVTDNLVEMMAGKISRLPKATQTVLKICACIGNRFDLETLAAVQETSVDQALGDLTEAVHEGLVSRFWNMYIFHHDRIQEAAYSLVTKNERSAYHYKIGKLALDTGDDDSRQKKLFYIVDQLNLGINMIQKAYEQENLAKLNLEAAQKAKASAAYKPALSFARMGIELLPVDCWDRHYELTYPMYMETMECEYLSLNFSEAENIFDIVVENAKSNTDKANVHTLMIILYTTQGHYEKALKVGYKGMKMVGMKLPKKVSDIRIGLELLKLRTKFGRMKIEDLIDMQYIVNPKNVDEAQRLIDQYLAQHPSKSFENPVQTIQEKLAYAYLAIHTGTVAYYVDSNLFAYIVINGLCLLLDFGVNFEYSPYAYLGIGSIVGSALGLPQYGHRFGLTALKLNEKMADIKNKSRVEFTFAMFIQHWKKHAREDLDFYRQAYNHGLAMGDLIFCGHSIKLIGETRIMLGDNLDDILEEYTKYREFQMGSKDPFNEHNYLETMQMCLCLKDLTGQTGRFNSDNFDENEHMSFYREENNLLGVFCLSLDILRIRYLFGNYAECHSIINELNHLIKKKVYLGALHVPEALFYSSLVMTAVYRQTGMKRRMKYKARLRINQAKMKIWSMNCPENYEHKYFLVEAEIARLKGKYKKAENLYDRAIKSAHENQYTQNEAIANERAALLMRESGDMEKARRYMNDALACYKKWGATAKTKHIEENYPDLIVRKSADRDLLSSTDIISPTASSQTLDMATVIKTSQALSSEIDLERLLANIMKISIENAGAQKGFLILDTNGELIIEAGYEEGVESWSVMQPMPLEVCNELSRAIVNFVHRSGEHVILGNASREGPFTNDPYIIQNNCKSILCTPIMNKGMLTGILYMENNLSADAFTPERLEVLKVISAQAAISIENAKLFELATTDGLTKLYVRRYFQLLLDKEIQRARRHNKPFALLMMDIDNFKAFNDTYGHQLGDEVLRTVARSIKNSSRSEDVAARFGGEEFIMFLPETNAEQAMNAAEKIRAMVEKLEIAHGTERLHLTISLGVSTFPEHTGAMEELIRLADMALYNSKHNGKNRVSLSKK